MAKNVICNVISAGAMMASLAVGCNYAHATTIEITEWGVFSGQDEAKQAAPGTARGEVSTLPQTTLVQEATTINACLGTRFGLRFRVPDAPSDGLNATVQVIHPPMQDQKGKSWTEEHWDMMADSQTREAGWEFQDPYELAEGEWTLSVSAADAKVSKTFQIKVARDCAVHS